MRRIIIFYVVILVLTFWLYCPLVSTAAPAATPSSGTLPGVQEINLPTTLCTNIAVITGRADGPHVNLKINGYPVNIEEDGSFAAEVFLGEGGCGGFVLTITSSASGAQGSLTHRVAAAPTTPILYFAATGYTNEGFALLQGRVNVQETSALLALVVPPIKDSGTLEKALPGHVFSSAVAETVIKGTEGNVWRQVLEKPGSSSSTSSPGGEDREEEKVKVWEVEDTTFLVPFDAAGSFSYQVPLFAGPNTIVLAAVTREGKVYSQARQCFYEFPLTLNPLPGETDRSLLIVSGETRPGNKVRVDVRNASNKYEMSTEATVLADGRFYAGIILQEGENYITVTVKEENVGWFTGVNKNIVHREYYELPLAHPVLYRPASPKI